MTDTDETSGNLFPGSRFATGFHKTTGDVFVYGALIFGAIMVGCGLAFGHNGYFLAALVCFGSSVHFYPYILTNDVQLGADSRGLYVGGLGLVDWDAVKSVELIRIAVRRVERAELRVSLARPLKDAVSVADVTPWWRPVMARHWSVKSGNQLVIRLEHLKASPDQIDEGVRSFWQSA